MSVEKSSLEHASRPLLSAADPSAPTEDIPEADEVSYAAEYGLGAEGRRQRQRQQRRRRALYVAAVLLGNLAVAALTALACWVAWGSRPAAMALPQDTFPALQASGALRWERRLFPTTIRDNPFAGEPSPELDLAWHDLFEDVRIKVSREDLEYYNVSSLAFADGSGYAAELGVMHELHCLKKIRHWIWRDYYLDEGIEDMVEYRAHIHHCLELMRESIMCRADTSLFTFKWIAGNPPHITAVAEGHHTCADWNSLSEWVHQRQYPVFEEGVLEGPS